MNKRNPASGSQNYTPKGFSIQIKLKGDLTSGEWVEADLLINGDLQKVLIDMFKSIKSTSGPKSLEQALASCDSFASRIKAARKYMMMTQDQLAAASGVSPASIKRYETVPTNPKEEQLNKLAKVFGCNPLWLLVG